MLNLLRQRRSIRDFDSRQLETEKIEALKEALLRAPSSRNLRPCSYIMIDDRGILDKLAEAKSHGLSFLRSAPLAVVIAADPSVSDVWIEDSALAAILVQLAAEEVGLKSCWGQLRLRFHKDGGSASAFVGRLVNLPEGYEAPVVVGIGYPREYKKGHPESLLDQSRIHINRFS